MPDSKPSTTPETLAGYNLWSTLYDTAENPLISLVNRALSLHPEPLANKRILEIGCGTARLAPHFLAAGASTYTGVDGSPGMLAQARRLLPNPRIQILEADIQTPLPLPTHSFDVIVISLVLEHIPALAPFFHNIARLLAPNGILRILELHADRQRTGTGAHFPHNGQDIRLPSYPHDATELHQEIAAIHLTLLHTLQHIPDDASITRYSHLTKYKNLPLLLDLRAKK
jgi:SAM-dependent methyltransferase